MRVHLRVLPSPLPPRQAPLLLSPRPHQRQHQHQRRLLRPLPWRTSQQLLLRHRHLQPRRSQLQLERRYLLRISHKMMTSPLDGGCSVAERPNRWL